MSSSELNAAQVDELIKSDNPAADGIVYGIYRDGVLETDLTDRLDVLALKLTSKGNAYELGLKINGFTQTTNPLFLPLNAAQGLRVIIGNDGGVTGTHQSNFEVGDPTF